MQPHLDAPPASVAPDKRPGTSIAAGERWAVFVDRVAAGTPPVDAARLAGYANPDETAQDLLRLPKVRKALAQSIEGRLLSEAAPLALRVALEILGDSGAAASIRGKMAVAILDRTKDKEPEGPGTGNLANLSQAQLAAFVAQLEAQGAVVVPLDVTPVRTPADAAAGTKG